MRFLYWNIHRQDLSDVLVALIRDLSPDFVLLSECELPSGVLVSKLNSLLSGSDRPVFYAPKPSLPPGPNNVLLSRYGPPTATQKLTDSPHFSAFLVRPMIDDPLLLFLVHLPSQLHARKETQTHVGQRVATDICDLEDKHEVTRTLVVGDFNSDPYDPCMLSAGAFHAVMCRTVAKRGQRKVLHTQTQPFFYNPMWNLYGDNPSPPGNYYYANSDVVVPFWHIFDQVLVRPPLIDSFDIESLRIVQEAGDHRLVSQAGRPRKKAYSDHLPFIFDLRVR